MDQFDQLKFPPFCLYIQLGRRCVDEELQHWRASGQSVGNDEHFGTTSTGHVYQSHCPANRHLMRWWPEPTAGEIVWCHFPDNIHPKPKSRLGLIVSTKADDEGIIFVSVAFGISQKTNRLFSGEVRISKRKHPTAYASASLSYDTKFDLRNVLELPFNDAYFSVPPHAPHGQIPKLGILHPSVVRIAASAFLAASK